MANNISQDQVKHVAELAKLELNDKQLDYFTDGYIKVPTIIDESED